MIRPLLAALPLDDVILKPCPFCGEVPILAKHFREDMWQLTHRCPAVGPITFGWSTPASIAKGWNRRA